MGTALDLHRARWAFRVIGWKSGQITTNWYRDWEDVTEQFARRVYLEPEAYAGFSERPDLSKCADVRCRIDTATNWVREKTSTVGVNTNRELPLAEAFKTGKASARERAMAVRKILEEAGVEAKLAVLTEPLSRQTMRSFPEWKQFNRSVVYVPAQPPALPRPVTVDLEAEYCAPGELPPQVRDQPGFVFWMEGGRVGSGEGAGEWVTLQGPPCRAPIEREVHRATISADGTVTDVLEVWAEGERSEPRQREQKDWSERELARRMRLRSAEVSGVGDSSNHRWLECERLKGICGRTVTLRGEHYAVKDGPNWLVPLTLLTPMYEFVDAETRQQDVTIFPGWGVTEETIDLEGPPGFHVGRLPDTVTASGPGVSVRIVAEKTKTGARLSRRVSFSPGQYPVSDYPRTRATLEAFRSLRQTVLTFEPD